MKRILLVALSFLLLIAMVSCGSSNVATKETKAKEENTTDAEKTGYQYYAGKNFNQAEICILNYESYCDTNLEFAPTERQSGDILNNAMMDRTAQVEEKLNVIISEDRKGYAEMGGWGGQAKLGTLVSTSVDSDTFQWDIANIFINWKASLITDGYLTDLNTLNELHLDEDYWDKNIMKELTLNGKCYTGSSKLTLMPFDLTWVLFFNEDRIADLGLDSPYTLVDNKQWTLDKLLEYVQAGTDLNGEHNFDFERNDTTVCGIAAHTDALSALVVAAGNKYVVKDANGEIHSSIENQHLYDTIEKVERIFSKSQGYSQLGVSYPNHPTEPYGCVNMFKAGRSVFVTAEVKTAGTLRDMEEKYGVLPTPLFDEEQTQYYAQLGGPALLTIPKLQKDISRTALVLDALSYESTSVMDTYYTKVVSHRNLRNEDSERMLAIIHEGLIIEFGSFFEFTSHYVSELNKQLRDESVTPASLAEAEADTIDLRIEKFLEKLNPED